MKKNARQKRIDDVHEFAVKAFAEHVIDRQLDQGVFRYWFCGKPKRCEYHFSITTVPGRMMIAGDIGFLTVMRAHDMIAWAREAVRSIEYFAEKVPHEIKTREYDEAVALEWLDSEARQIRADHPDNWRALIDKIRELRKVADNDVWFKQNLYESKLVDGCDFPDLDNWSHNFLWCREALMWMLERIEDNPLNPEVNYAEAHA